LPRSKKREVKIRNQKYPRKTATMPENPLNPVPPVILKIIKLTPEIEKGNTNKKSNNEI
jgi:hypothetical protein